MERLDVKGETLDANNEPLFFVYWVLISESKCANPIKATNFIQSQMTYKLFSKFPSLMDFVHKRQWQVVLLPCWCHH